MTTLNPWRTRTRFVDHRPVWKRKNGGKELYVDEMSNSHLIAVIRLIYREYAKKIFHSSKEGPVHSRVPLTRSKEIYDPKRTQMSLDVINELIHRNESIFNHIESCYCEEAITSIMIETHMEKN